MRPYALVLAAVGISAGVALTLALPAAATAPTDYVLLSWTFDLGSSDPGNIHPGDTITVEGSGLPDGSSINAVLHSVPTLLGTVAVGSNGSFKDTVTIPVDTAIGAHRIVVTASGPDFDTTSKQEAITVVSGALAVTGNDTTSKTTTVAPQAATKGHASRAHVSPGIQPNILTRALTPITDVATHPNKIVAAFEVGLVLLLLAVLPAHLLNATLAEQSERFERRFSRFRRPAPHWLHRLDAWFKSAPVVGGVLVTLATAVVLGFADPTFGFSLASLRLVLACGIALFLVGYVANALTGVIARIQWNIVAAVSTRPYGIILTIVGVLISRLLHFSPGFLIGLILGLTIQGKSASAYAWRTVVTRTVIVLVMAIAAWIGYSTLTLGNNEGGTFGSELLVETLVAIATEGVVALLVELLPLRFLEGERVYAHSRVLWGILYFVTVVVFVLGVLSWQGNWSALGNSLWVWLGVFVGFTAICVGVYIYFRRFAKPLEASADEESVAIGETVSGDRS
jgi:hypothetical protein